MTITRSLLAICVICSVLFFLNPQSRDFWAPDEGDFAQIARELPDNPVVPHLNGKPYGEKPPLFYYITFLSKIVFRSTSDEVSLRFPSGLFALLGIIFFFVTIRKFFDHHKALLAACILLSTPLYYWQARYLQVDMVFSVFVSSCLLFFFWFYNTRKEYLIYLSFLFLAFAFLTKGPSCHRAGLTCYLRISLAREVLQSCPGKRIGHRCSHLSRSDSSLVHRCLRKRGCSLSL